MSKSIYEEAIADAKKVREAAEANAKSAILESVTPKIREFIEQTILEQDKKDKDEEEKDPESSDPEIDKSASDDEKKKDNHRESTLIVMNFDAPSPSAVILLAKFKSTLCRLLSKLIILSSFILFIIVFFADPVANKLTISFVLVSPSQLIALNVVSIFFFKSFFNIFDDIFASVNIYPSVVAIFGKIIPDPLATP